MRKNLAIPEVGFWSKTLSDKWISSNPDKLSELHGYVESLSNMSQLITNGFDEAIREFIVNGDVSDEILDACDATGCALKIISKDQATANVPEGVYIKLGPLSTRNDVFDFVRINFSKIDSFRKETVLSTGKRPKKEDFLRNETVYWLGTMPLNELREMVFKSFPEDQAVAGLSRDELGSRMMKRFIFEVDSDNFRQILHREKENRRT